MVQKDAYQVLIAALCEIHELSAALKNALWPLVGERAYLKNQLALNAGNEQQFILFILKGYAREISPSDEYVQGETTWFWFSGNFVFHTGFFSRQAAEVDIEFYRDTVVLEISYEKLANLFIDFPEIYLLAEKLRMYDSRIRKRHTSDLVNLRRTVHFKKFYSQNKPLFNIARHKDIASFLGIRNHGLNRYLKNQ